MKPKRFPVLWLMATSVILFMVFAAVFDIDQAVRAQGQAIAGARTQIIQAVDGGMLTAIRVKEGDHVKAGQLLAKLASDRARAGYNQASAEVASKSIALIRARAELLEQMPRYGNEYAAWNDFVQAQTGIWRQRLQSLNDELSVHAQALKLAEDELAMNQRLLVSGDIGQSEVMRAQRQVLDVQGRISSVRNKYFQESRADIAKLEDELAAGRAKLDDRKSVLKNTDLVSPMDGIIKLVRVTTVGGVLKPGDELLQISPTDDELLIEIKINPVDIGELKLGLPVALRFDAFDASTHGKVEGVLRYLSPDTLSEQGPGGQALTYYRAQVAIDWNQTHQQPANRLKPADIKPGMTVTADVLTGQRSILAYLAKPVLRAFSGALTQR
jgi:adhesin transport system membrane fusion protein